MAKNSIETYGAEGKTNLLSFDPAKLKLVTDEKHPLYDPRVDLPLSDEMVASIMLKGVVKPIIVWKDPESGETVVVDGRQRVRNAIEANKRLRKRGASIALEPANAAYETRIFGPDRVKIQGRLAGLYRRYH